MNRKIKTIIAAITAAAAAASVSAAAFADSSGFVTESELARPVKAPYDTKYVNIQWNTTEAETAGVPIAEGEHFLFPYNNKVSKIAEKNGEILGTAELDEKISENCRGAVLDGTLIQPARTSLYSVNTADMSVSASKSFGGNISTDVALSGSYAYFGVESDSGSTFYCVDYTNNFSVVWEYGSDSAVTSASENTGHVIFGAGTKLVVHDKDDDSFVETELGADIAAAPLAGEYAVYIPAADGELYKLRLNDDGTMEEDSLASCTVGAEPTTPAVFNGRLYISSADGFFILDSLNMEVIEKFSDMKGGTAPFICYGNGPRAYVVAPMDSYWCLYTVYDPGEGTDPEETKLAKLENFEGGKYTVSNTGTLCFRDGYGRLYALNIAEYSIFFIVLKLVLLLVLVVLIVLWLRFVIKKRLKDKSNFL